MSNDTKDLPGTEKLKALIATKNTLGTLIKIHVNGGGQQTKSSTLNPPWKS